jgi:D-alanyl-D-alanine carboxypeptidase
MRKFLILLLLVGVVGGSAYAIRQHNQDNQAVTNTPKTVHPSKSVASGFDKTIFSTSDPASLWVVVNKQHALTPKDYVPADLVMPNVPQRVPGNESMQLRQVTATALEAMFAAAAKDGLQLMLSSGYRSYKYQVNLYNGYVASEGQATADTQSARPGHSEHQTGFAADVEPSSKHCEVESCFGDTPEGKWVAENAYKYGFIIRYTPGNEDITGYEPEPWHIRYVGEKLAYELHRTNTTTLEQFFDITGGKTYAN